jgi:hypothetical protein
MISADHQLLAGGAYARKQLYCKDRIVAWSHGARFLMGRRLAENLPARGLWVWRRYLPGPGA